jgi:hypothetical protein
MTNQYLTGKMPASRRKRKTMDNQAQMNKKGQRNTSVSMFRNALGAPKFWVHKGQQAMAGVLALVLLPASMGAAFAQDQSVQPTSPPNSGDQGPGGAPPSMYEPLSTEQLNQLVAPISLYPDSLVAQVLAASTYPEQVAAAEQFMHQNSGTSPQQLGQMADTQPWDPSVKALVAFPQVLHDLNKNLSWTTQLGNAYYNQPQDVLGAVQGMRQRAYAAGTLRPSPQLAVTYAPGHIVIAPVDPAVVYVPAYNPWTVYGAPLAVYPNYSWGPPPGVAVNVGLGFGAGVEVGAFAGFGWGFHAWAPNWGGAGIVFNHNTYISNSTTVFNHGGPGYNPGGPMIPNHNPGGPMVPNHNPGGPMVPNHNPGGPMVPNHNPGGPMIPNHNPGGPINHEAAGGLQTSGNAPAQKPHQQVYHGMSDAHHGASHRGARHGLKGGQSK